MVKILFLILSLHLMLPEGLYSRVDTTAGRGFFTVVGDDFKTAWYDIDSVGSRVGSMGLKDVAIGAGLIGTTLLISIADDDMRDLTRRNLNPESDVFANIGREYGQTYTAVGLGGALYLGGYVAGSEEIRTTGRLLFESLALAGLVTTAGKVASGRARPYMDQGPGEFRGMQFTNDYWSFPSGHSTVAFTISSVLSSRIDRWWASAALYSLAGLTAYSRMYHDQHWFSDVFMGAAIGTISGRLICGIQDAREDSSRKRSSLYILPDRIFYCYVF